MEKRTFAEKSIERRLLEQRLSEMREDEEITYDELSKLIGKDIRNGAKHFLADARQWACDHHDVVTRCIPNVGIKRLKDADIVGAGLERAKHVRKSAGRGIRELSAVREFDKLTNQQKITHNAVTMSLALARFSAKPTTTRKLESKINPQMRELPVGRILELVK